MTNQDRPEVDVELAVAAAAGADAHAEAAATVEIMDLLHEHVPLTLVADLTDPTGPASPDILEEEGLPEVAWWEGGERPTGDDAAGS